jgi:hypothetical protein
MRPITDRDIIYATIVALSHHHSETYTRLNAARRNAAKRNGSMDHVVEELDHKLQTIKAALNRIRAMKKFLVGPVISTKKKH